MKHISLSDGEWKIMKLLWNDAPRTIGEIVDALNAETGWSRTTVFVMLKRLVAKNAVRLDDSGRLQEYYPLIGRRDVTPEETDSFLARVYDGSIGMMVSSMAGRQALSQEDIAELRQILDDAEKSRKG